MKRATAKPKSPIKLAAAPLTTAREDLAAAVPPAPPQTDEQASGKRALIIFLFIAIAVTLAYANHFHNDFHFDDAHTVQNNIYIKSVKNIPRFFYDGTTFSSLPTNQSYRPLVTAT